MTENERKERAKNAARARWGNRGVSSTIRVDRAAYEALMAVPAKDRRRVASEAVLKAVDELNGNC